MLLTYYLFVLLILAAWYGIYRYWSRKVAADVSDGASFEFKRLQKVDPALLEGVDEERFRAIYERVEMPRQPFFTWMAAAVFLLGAPLVLAVTTMTLSWMEVVGIIPQPAEQAQQLKLSAEGIRLVRTADLEALQLILQGWGGFFSFFALLIFWVAVFYAVMRRYHAQRPGSLRDEVLRAR